MTLFHSEAKHDIQHQLTEADKIKRKSYFLNRSGRAESVDVESKQSFITIHRWKLHTWISKKKRKAFDRKHILIEYGEKIAPSWRLEVWKLRFPPDAQPRTPVTIPREGKILH